MKAFRVAFGLLLLAALFTGCSAGAVDKPAPLLVTLLQEDTYRLAEGYEYQTAVAQGDEVRFVLYPAEGYIITGTDVPNGIITKGAGESSILILRDIQYPTRVRVLCEPDTNICTVIYDANGGMTLDGKKSYIVHHALNGHKYPNTDNGAALQKKRCTLIGWNTEPDGSGESVGLGSRCRTEEKNLTLYAQWLSWTDDGQFVFQEGNDSCTVTAYSGTDQTVVVPAVYHGLPVKTIAEGAFTEKQIEVLSLPVDLESIENGAFFRCVIDKIIFFDNISEFPDAAFLNTLFPEIHILAAQPPRYAGSGRASNYADKVDLLFSHRNDKKIVLFGGSGTYYSVLAAQMQHELSDEYIVLNMGINGWFPAMPQLDVIRVWMHSGDILLHMPEMASATQLFADTRFALPVNDPTVFDDRYMRSLELNYELIADIDLGATEGFFDSFTRFNNARSSQPPTSYSDYSHYINGNGDFPNRKLSYQKNEPITREADICPEFLSEEALRRMNSVYDSFADKGIQVVISFAAVNEDSLSEIPDYMEKAERFEELLKENAHAVILGRITDAFYPGSVFYNSDWHLSEEADIENTTRITTDLMQFLVKVSTE